MNATEPDTCGHCATAIAVGDPVFVTEADGMLLLQAGAF